jgi:outer membrane protein
MKHWFRYTVGALLFLSLLGGTASAQTRIGTVNLRKVFENYWKTKQADAALKDRASEMEKQHKDLLEDYKKSRESYQGLLSAANDQALSNEERDKRKKAAEDKLRQLKDAEETITQFERSARSTIDEQRKRMRDNLVEEIRGVLNSKAKTAGYTLVIDTSADSINATPVVLFTNNDNDMTEMLLNQLNAAAPADAPKPDAPVKEPEKKDAKK